MSMMDKLTGSIDSNNANSQSSSKTDTSPKSIFLLEDSKKQRPEVEPTFEPFGHDQEGGNARQYYSCCFPIAKPSILLRNLIVPAPLWKFFPEGIGILSCFIGFLID
jgi:hypothetical protein